MSAIYHLWDETANPGTAFCGLNYRKPTNAVFRTIAQGPPGSHPKLCQRCARRLGQDPAYSASAKPQRLAQQRLGLPSNQRGPKDSK